MGEHGPVGLAGLGHRQGKGDGEVQENGSDHLTSTATASEA